ncbi:RING finger protein nhl-1 isoform X3 [Bradysia coprophila]|uniref:RING finger protein nhl-1 isoform X3 n=1 Tax=Bradysia coprophila TaxID=38358 RepID=UPI00187D7790|nr:RING finger protein nhl-1 isoform X3 [Bradysia coprophila]
MEQFEQLLTCCVCLDRYRNPKLLPCQHSFCMEPCMEGLVDYVRRQVKCPECRAEHRIPYQGVQAFPTNVTLQRFLELRMEITGEPPDPTSGQIMERCNVCSEKAYLSPCAHCDKKICEDCKSAHMDILRREITRINSQIRRGVHRLQDSLSIVEKNTLSLQTNCLSVSEEVDEVYRRMSKALKDRAEHLRSEIERYLSTELRNLTALKDNLDLEVANIQSNCDVADKYINDNVEWDDCELMDTKEIFLRTVEFIRNFEYENTDYNRRVRFFMEKNPNELVTIAATFGELHVQPHSVAPNTNSNSSLQPPSGPGLMRSKSDHRLATQFRQQEERGLRDDDEPVLGGRKFGERQARATDRYSGGDAGRYGRNDYDYGNDYEPDTTSRSTKSRFRSRFVRSHQNDDNSDNEQGRNVRFNEKDKEKERDRVIDTEDVARGHLSGIIRLTDSPRVMKRLQEQEKGKKEKKIEATPAAKPAVVKRVTAAAPAAARQMSEDEIDRIKRQNKGSSASTAAAEPDRPTTERVAALKSRTTAGSEDSDSSPSSPVRRTPPQVEADSEDSDGSITSPQQPNKTPGSHVKTTRSASSDSSTSTESSTSSSAVRNTGATYTTKEVKQKLTANTKPETSAVRTRPVTEAPTSTSTVPEKKPFQSRFLPNHQQDKKQETESSSEEETSSEESEEEEEEEEKTPAKSPAKDSALKTDIGPLLARSSNARDSQADSARRISKDESSSRGGYSSPTTYSRGYERESSPKYTRTRPTRDQYEEPKYGSPTTGTSGYGTSSSLGGSDLSRSRSSHALKSREASPVRSSGGSTETDKDGAALSSWARYLKNKYGNRSTKDASRDATTAASSSSATPSSSSTSAARRLSLGLPLRQANEVASSDDDSKNGLGSPISPTAAAVGIQVVAGISPRTQYLQKRRQLFQLGGRGSEPGCFTWPRGCACGPDNSIVVADSSNHRVQVFDSNGIFVKEFGQYGNGEGEFDCLAGVTVNRIGQFIIADRYNHRIQVLDPSGRFLRAFGSQGTADGKFNYPWGVTTDALGFIYVSDKENHRVQVFQSDGTFVGKFGTSGKDEGQLEHPHYIAVSNTNRVIVSDSNNHRIQIFDVNGRVLSAFGTEGSEEGQFKFPRGVAVDDQGYICVADSGNNRIQIFHPDGSFLRAFGSWGSGDAEFKGLEGVAIMSNGNILVCDRENHRVQVF